MTPPDGHESSKSKAEEQLLTSHHIEIDLPGRPRPGNIRHVSLPAYESPLRHRCRQESGTRQVKETLHARSEYSNSGDDGGSAIHRINQYVIKQEIGRGSFGAVHLAVDQHGTEFAVKEFSKSRLRKRAKSHILRHPHASGTSSQRGNRHELNRPLHQSSSKQMQEEEGETNPLFLIKEEIAIMKKLNHVNLVSLIEVLDDPHEDSLYMVLEMCKKGVIMHVGVDERTKPYTDDECRCWFRDLILGIEYLHAQGIVHRDIKPDNLLLTEDNILKIVDFGVSEIFEKSSEMYTAKSAGSPAFLPPELCVAKHGDVSGRAADIWSMGVTLYCLRFGHLPFEKSGALQLYESIREDPLELDDDSDVDDACGDLLVRLLEKDPNKRIQMRELRDHPWVTRRGRDPLLSEDENIGILVKSPTAAETEQAITGNMMNLVAVMKAVKRFKELIEHRRPTAFRSILGHDDRIVQDPDDLSLADHCSRPAPIKTRSEDTSDRHPVEAALAAEGIHHTIDPKMCTGRVEERLDSAIVTDDAKNSETERAPNPERKGLEAQEIEMKSSERPTQTRPEEHRESHEQKALKPRAQTEPKPSDDPSPPIWLHIGNGLSSAPPSPPIISESPPPTDANIYETAYEKEVERIRTSSGHSATLFLTRRVEQMEDYLKGRGVIKNEAMVHAQQKASHGFSKLVAAASQKARFRNDSAER